MADNLSYMTPGLAAMMGGRREALEREKTLEDLMSQRQTYQFNEQRNPLMVEHQGLANQGLRAQIPGMQAQSSMLGTQANEASATSPGRIAATNADNASKTGAAKTTELERHRRVLTEANMELEGVADPMQRRLVISQIFQNHGVPMDQSSQNVMEMAVNAPDQFKKFSEAIDKRNTTNTSAYRAAMDTQELQNKGAMARTNREWDSREKINTDQLNGGRFKRGEAVKTLEQQLAKEGDPLKRFSILLDHAQIAMDAGDNALAQQLLGRAKTLQASGAVDARNPNAGPKPGGVDLAGTTKGGIAAHPNRPVTTPQLQQTPTQPGQPAGPAAVPQAAKPFDPNQQIHPGAVQTLKQGLQNPDPQAQQMLKAQFDQVFGRGAADAVLRQR